jgi:DNA-binding response OmpR family regulator
MARGSGGDWNWGRKDRNSEMHGLRIAVVEDDDAVGSAIEAGLTRFGHAVVRFSTGADLLLRHTEVNFVILDLGLPGQDGVDVLRDLRKVSALPVIVLTARDDERTIVRVLRSGADDYLVKPARLPELTARIDVVRRRSAAQSAPRPQVIDAGELHIDIATREVRSGDDIVDLTPKEFDVLAVLLESAGAAVSREEVLDRVWGDAYAAISRSLDVHIAMLRQKLGKPRCIATIRGFGYRWDG